VKTVIPPHLNTRDYWHKCSKCSVTQPHENFVNERGEDRKTCNKCRATRARRKAEQCECGECLDCRNREARIEKQMTKYNSWEIFGEDACYLKLHRRPLKTIVDLYEGRD
jgi:hypothetical protein